MTWVASCTVWYDGAFGLRFGSIECMGIAAWGNPRSCTDMHWSNGCWPMHAHLGGQRSLCPEWCSWTWMVFSTLQQKCQQAPRSIVDKYWVLIIIYYYGVLWVFVWRHSLIKAWWFDMFRSAGAESCVQECSESVRMLCFTALSVFFNLLILGQGGDVV